MRTGRAQRSCATVPVRPGPASDSSWGHRSIGQKLHDKVPLPVLPVKKLKFLDRLGTHVQTTENTG